MKEKIENLIMQFHKENAKALDLSITFEKQHNALRMAEENGKVFAFSYCTGKLKEILNSMPHGEARIVNENEGKEKDCVNCFPEKDKEPCKSCNDKRKDL